MVAIAEQETGSQTIWSFQARFRACCVTQSPVGWAVMPARWTLRLANRHEEEARQPDRPDREQVTGQDLFSMLTHKLLPGALTAPGGGRNADEDLVAERRICEALRAWQQN